MGFFDNAPAPAFKFEDPKDTARGEVLNVFEVQQQEFEKGKPVGPKFWKNGAPAMSVAIVVQTDNVDRDDDGRRTVFANRPGRMFTAIQKAIKDAGGKDIEVGATISVTYTGDDEDADTKIKPKLYRVKYALPEADSAKDDDDSDDDDDDDVDPAALKAALRKLGRK